MINVSKVKVKEGGTRYVVNVRMNGRRQRKYFATKKEAADEASRLSRERRSHGDQFASLDEVERAELVVAFHIGQKHGFSVIDAVKAFREKAELREARRVSIGDAIRRCLREKKSALKDSSYDNLSGALERFGEGRWNAPLDEILRSNVYEWIVAGQRADGEPWKSPTRNGYLVNLKTLFNWCVAEGLLDESPAANIRKFKPSDDEIAGWENENQILSVEQMDTLLNHFKDNDPDLLPRILLGAFAGLRPEREAALMSWGSISFDDREIFVSGAHAKDRQRRYVPMTDNLHGWLLWAYNKKLSFDVDGWEERWQDGRRAIGMVGESWPHDGLRKSFASYYMAVNGEDATREILGHGSFDMLFKHYRSAVRRVEGEAYFGISC